jgi:hypothetical protein
MGWNDRILDCWKTGYGRMRSIYMDATDQKIKSDHHLPLSPNIPFFQHSIIPLSGWRFEHTSAGVDKAGSSGSGLFAYIG